MTYLPHTPRHDGYYDDRGRWQRTKFCFMDCGKNCTCGPPLGRYYSEAHDKRKEQPASIANGD
jgi:hypothetical protein